MNNNDGYVMAFNAVYHPYFLAKIKQECDQWIIPIVHSFWGRGFKADSYFRLGIELNLQTGKNCQSWKRIFCSNVEVFRPDVGKCHKKFGQKIPKVKSGSKTKFPTTNACDELNVKLMTCKDAPNLYGNQNTAWPNHMTHMNQNLGMTVYG